MSTIILVWLACIVLGIAISRPIIHLYRSFL